METDGYDHNDDHVFDDLDAKHTRAMAARAAYDRGIVSQSFFRTGNNSGGWGGSGAGVPVDYLVMGGGGGGGGAGFASGRVLIDYKPEPTKEERQEMSWTNPEAADIAREILNDEKREGLRETVTAAVALYREMLADAHCGSVYSFMKINEDGKHYWYAAIKNGGKWYTTAQNPRVLEGDDEFITWLISLGAHESQAAELTVGAANYAHELGPIDATASE